MKRKIAALLATVLVMTMGATTVFAAGSPVPEKVEKPAEQVSEIGTVEVAKEEVKEVVGAKAEAAEEKHVEAAVATVKNLLNDVKALGERVGSDVVKAAATDATKKVSAEVKTVVELKADAATQALFDAGKKAEITIKLDSVKAGDNIVILHYANGAWETIAPTSVVDGAVTGMFSSLSPVAIVKIVVATANTQTTDNNNTTVNNTTDNTTPVAPKTGVVFPIAAIAAGFCLAGAAVCEKKVKFN